MATYTYHGNGTVTVSPSKGQTGGSGFGAEGTYASERAARNAVASRSNAGAISSPGTVRVYDTRTGQYTTISKSIYDSMKSQGSTRYSESASSRTYIGSSQPVVSSQPVAGFAPDRITQLELQLHNAPPGTNISGLQADIAKERAQLAAKRTMLESPTAHWSSAEAYHSAYSGLGNYAERVNPPHEIIIAGTPATRRREAERQFTAWKSAEGIEPSTARMITNEYGEITGFEGIKKTDLFPEFSGTAKPFPEAFAEFQQYQKRKESRIEGSQFVTMPFYKAAAGVSAGLESAWGGLIGYSESSHPVKKYVYGAGQSIAILPEFVASGVTGWEAFARHPKKSLENFIPSASAIGGNIVSQAKEKPFETAGFFTGALVGGKTVKGVKAVGGKIGELKVPMPKNSGTLPSLLVVPKSSGVDWKMYPGGLIKESTLKNTPELQPLKLPAPKKRPLAVLDIKEVVAANALELSKLNRVAPKTEPFTLAMPKTMIAPATRTRTQLLPKLGISTATRVMLTTGIMLKTATATKT